MGSSVYPTAGTIFGASQQCLAELGHIRNNRHRGHWAGTAYPSLEWEWQGSRELSPCLPGHKSQASLEAGQLFAERTVQAPHCSVSCSLPYKLISAVFITQETALCYISWYQASLNKKIEGGLILSHSKHNSKVMFSSSCFCAYKSLMLTFDFSGATPDSTEGHGALFLHQHEQLSCLVCLQKWQWDNTKTMLDFPTSSFL